MKQLRVTYCTDMPLHTTVCQYMTMSLEHRWMQTMAACAQYWQLVCICTDFVPPIYHLFLSQSLVSLCELRSTTDFPYTAELDSAFGAAVGSMGPRWVYHMCGVCCFVVVYRWPRPVYLPAVVVWLLLFMICCCLHTGESSCKLYVFGCCVVVIVYVRIYQLL